LLLSIPRRVEVKNSYGRLLFRVPLFFVGTYDLKLWLSHALKCIEIDKELLGGLRMTKDIADETYLEQMTAEVLVPRERRDGMVVKEWHKIRPRNEALDLAVYARAGAFGAHPNGLGVDRFDPRKWAGILSERHAASDVPPDLFAEPLPKEDAAPSALKPEAPAPKPRNTLADLARRLHGS